MSKQLSVRTSEIMNAFKDKGILLEMIGEDRIITSIVRAEDSAIGSLVFVDKKDYVSQILTNKPTAVVTSQKMLESFCDLKDVTILIASNVNLAQAHIKRKYAARSFENSDWPRIHPTALIHASVKIPESTFIEPYVVIQNNVKIGERTRIMTGSVIEHDVVIGNDTMIHSNVIIGYGCEIGNEVAIHSNSVIGSEGYGFAQDDKGKSHPIPQTGIVIIEDRVRIGAGCCVDRAAYHVTKIGAGTKLDNLCHVAHNVEVGQDCLLTSMCCIAGSSKLGDRVITSGQTGILDHMNICSDVVLLHRAGITKDVDKPGAYAGLPLQPLQSYLKNAVIQKNLVELKERIKSLEDALAQK
ncbi:MAG: UDP-3-O-(3-hydroxymyristoyl)glucosamine N-acyltransferase [Oligoflexia bacterium]|nr:UDP-3-O-(3-hydroxymyristoyl)glucosamine N-acyltransferase [Oligoflexia bacterium]